MAQHNISEEEIEQAMVEFDCDRKTAISFLKADAENRDYLLELNNNSDVYPME